MRYSILSLLVIIFLMVSFRSPHTIEIKGKVMSSTGKALPGVLVTEKGTDNKTLTDGLGNFIIIVTSQKSLLSFQSTGFKVKETRVSAKAMTVWLTPVSNSLADSANTSLSEVVVIGYGNAKRKEMMLQSGKVANSPVTNGQSSILMKADAMPPRSSYSWPEQRSDNKEEEYESFKENKFLRVGDNPLSTFSIDVDAASYSNVRRYLNIGQMPPVGSVRIEEMINYFHYDYPQPVADDPFSINTEMAACPWNSNHKLVLVGLQGKKIPTDKLPASNIVFLIDVSGSMMDENKLPLVRSSMKLLVDQLRAQDKVSIVVYAGNAGLVLPPTSGSEKIKIKDAIDRLEAGGSTAGGEGILLAYKTAGANFIEKGNNRVILCTDGDFNVGASSDKELETLIENERKTGVFLTVLGYGVGNYKDNKMQKLADKGNGNHAYIDGFNEARKVLVNEFGGTLFTIAKDVKIQVEFNPAKVQSYRLIGYENRILQKEDFNNDVKDAGELGSGHTVTAMYEIIPVGVKSEFDESVDPFKYQYNPKPKDFVSSASNEVMTIKFRYKTPDGSVSKLIVHPLTETQTALNQRSSNFRFAASVAEFGMLLSNSQFKQSSSYDNALELAKNALGIDEGGYRSEFLNLLKNAQTIDKGTARK